MATTTAGRTRRKGAAARSPIGADALAEMLERRMRASLLPGDTPFARGDSAEAARFLLDADVTVAGRHPEADIFLDDVTVSRRHAEFVRVGTAFQVRDLGSLNGTYYDGVRIESALLSDGAEVQVGKFRLTFYASRLDKSGAK